MIHIASMFSREDVVKLLLNKRGVDPYSMGGVSIELDFRLAPLEVETTQLDYILTSKVENRILLRIK